MKITFLNTDYHLTSVNGNYGFFNEQSSLSFFYHSQCLGVRIGQILVLRIAVIVYRLSGKEICIDCQKELDDNQEKILKYIAITIDNVSAQMNWAYKEFGKALILV